MYNSDWLIGEHTYRQFIEDCRLAVSDPVYFPVFRQMPGIACVTENKDVEHKVLKPILSELWRHSHTTLEDAAFLHALDDVGTPRRHHITRTLHVSHTLIHTLEDVCVIREFMGGTLHGKHVVEIGGGYGLLAAMVVHFLEPASYTIYDLPEVCDLQKKYLHHVGIDSVKLCTDATISNVSDLAISLDSISELPLVLRQTYVDSVLDNAERGFIRWNCTRAATTNVLAAMYWLRNASCIKEIGLDFSTEQAAAKFHHSRRTSHIFWGGNTTCHE